MINQDQLYSGVILTPHAGEFAVLSGETLPSGFSSFSERIKKVMSITQDSKAVWLVKGPWDIISDSKKYKINKTGIPEMTRGGTGDILAGLAASYVNKTSESFYAASIAAFINGKAGELAFREFSTMNLIAKIPEAIQSSWDFIKED
jgi:NAD(P)H-hydrate epimerase